MAISCMHNEKYAMQPLFMVELPKFPRVIGNQSRGTPWWR